MSFILSNISEVTPSTMLLIYVNSSFSFKLPKLKTKFNKDIGNGFTVYTKFFLLKFFLYNTLKSLFSVFETLYGLQAAMKTNLSSNGLPYMVFLHKISVKSPIE